MSTTMVPPILNVIRGAIASAKANRTSSPFSCLDIFLLCVSTASFVADIGTDAIVIIQYFMKQHYMWMMLTMSLVCIPSLLIQIFSIRWHIADGDNSNFMWAIHILQLGVFHRYIALFKVGLQVRNSKSGSELRKFNQQQSDICMLRLFESFMESAPQLVLQLYIMVSLEDWNLWTGISAVASVFSLSWGIAAYSKTMRNIRPEKNHLSWYGLIFQAFWRIGAVSARIISMVLFAVAYGPYLLLIMFLHWLCMTIWVVNQNTDFCDTLWEERLYNGIVGTIYCFCFFNLKEGHSRWRMTVFYSLTSFQNIGFLSMYCFSTKAEPSHSEIAVILVLVGMVVGLISMLLYYRYFHPSGPITLYSEKRLQKDMQEAVYKTSTESYSNLKLYRKHTLSFNDTPAKDPSSHDEEDDRYAKVVNGADISVLSGRSRLGCQSDLHRSHSLNCSSDNCDMENHCTPGYRKKRFLSKFEANHLRTVNYNLRSAAVFGELKTAFHCSCLVLVHNHDDKYLCESLNTIQPSASLPNLIPYEPQARSPVFYFLSDHSDEHSVSVQSQIASDRSCVQSEWIADTDGIVNVALDPISPHPCPETQFPVGSNHSDQYSISVQSQTASDRSCASSDVHGSVVSGFDSISPHPHSAAHLPLGADHSDECSVSVQQSPLAFESHNYTDVSALAGANNISYHCASSTAGNPEIYKIDDVIMDLSDSNVESICERPSILPSHIMKLSISY